MRLRFFLSFLRRIGRRPEAGSRPAPGWVEELDSEQRARLARNLRGILEPRKATEREIRTAS